MNGKLVSGLNTTPLVFIEDTMNRGFFPKSGCDVEIVTTTIVSGSYITDKVFDVSTFAGFSVYIPAPWTASNLALFGSHSITGGFGPMRDYSGTVLEISGIVTGSWYTFPMSDAFPIPYVQLRSQNSAGTPIFQTGARSLIFCIKG